MPFALRTAPRTADIELLSMLSPLQLTPERLAFLTAYTIKHVGRYNDTIRNSSPQDVAARIRLSAPTSYELGDWQGVASFFPIYPGHDAAAHVAVWDPLFMRRPQFGRFIFKHVFSRWHLRKIYTCIPEPHRLANQLAERMGMTLEGRLRHAFMYNGKPVTGMYWGMLKEEAHHG